MEKQKKGLIRKSWCFFLAIVGIISLIGTPSIASLAERSSGLSAIPIINTVLERNTAPSNDIAPDDPGSPTFDDPWEVTLNFVESVKSKQDTAVFGEAGAANDGSPADSYDVPKPGMPPEPYLYAYFDAGMTAPYDKLWEDFKHYPGNPDKVWDLYVKADTSGPTFDQTDITITWNKNAINATEYQHIDLYLDATKIANMLAVSTVKFTADSGATNHLQIKCHVNQAPVVTDIPDQTIAEGGSFTTIALDGYVTDVEDPDSSIVWTYSGNTALTVTITDRVATIGIPSGDWNGAETITFIATDTGALSDSDAATFTVTAVNDPPVVGDIPDQTIAEGGSFTTIALDGYVTDVEDPDSSIVWTYSGNTALTVTITDRVATIGIPSGDWNGAETITFIATDTGALSDSDAATFTVTAVNDPPVVGDIPDQTIAEGGSFTTIALDGYVTDVEDPDSSIVWTYSGNTALTVTITDRVATIGIPSGDWNGAETITFIATDTGALSDSDAATFTVTAVNDPPVVGDIPDQTIAEGGSFTTIALDGYVTDVEDPDSSIVWTYSGNTALTVTITDRVATIGIPSGDWNGAETITFIATDTGALSDSDAATFTVTAVNDPPTANPQSVITNEETAKVIALTGSDIDGNIAKYTIASLPSNGDLWDGAVQIIITPTDLSANTVEYRPDTGYSGSDSFTFTVTDDGTPLPAQTSSPATISITIIQYHSISVKAHWNLISIPVDETISKANIIVRYDSHDYTWAQAVIESIVLDTIYDWQRGSAQAYASTDTLVPGNGYWMWAYFDCELLIASNAVGTGHITDLQTKWNIMGLPYSTPLPAANLITTYDGHDHTWTEATDENILLGFIYGWDSATQMYVLKTTFEPGQGYWMYAYYDCILKE